MRAYLALLGAGFHRQTTYRLALVAGLATNAFFGVVRTATAFDLGRTLSVEVTRTVPTLAVAALVLPLRLPGTLGGLALLAVSLVLAAVVSFQLRFLFASAAFRTPDYRSLFMLLFPVLWLLSGFVIPVEFFPGPLRVLVDWSPLIPLLMAPVRVATGHSAVLAVAGQVAWVVVLWLAGRVVLALASRRLVVHGG